MKDGAGVSCVEPGYYAARFQHALTDELLDDGFWSSSPGAEEGGGAPPNRGDGIADEVDDDDFAAPLHGP